MINKSEPNNGNHLTTDRMYRKFGLIGYEVDVKFLDAPSTMWNDFFMPARIIDEHEKYITIEILPHKNPYDHLAMSKPYTMCINKYRIWIGDVILVVDGMRFIQ